MYLFTRVERIVIVNSRVVLAHKQWLRRGIGIVSIATPEKDHVVYILVQKNAVLRSMRQSRFRIKLVTTHTTIASVHLRYRAVTAHLCVTEFYIIPILAENGKKETARLWIESKSWRYFVSPQRCLWQYPNNSVIK